MGCGWGKKRGTCGNSRPVAPFFLSQKTLKLNLLLLTMAAFSSSLPQAIPTPMAGAAVALPTDGERRHRHGQSPSEVSLTRTELPGSSPLSFLFRTRDRPDPGAPPSHTMPVQPRVRQLRLPRPGLPPRCYCRLQRAPSEMPAATPVVLLFQSVLGCDDES